jgi:hypothetical protein
MTPEQLCSRNLKGARLDRINLKTDPELDKQYLSNCAQTWAKIQKYSRRYKDAVTESCTAISTAMAQAKSCAPNIDRSKEDTGYLQCLQQAKKRVDNAVTAQKSLIDKLNKWKGKIEEAEEKNRDALKKYKDDLNKAAPALERTKSLMYSESGLVGTQAAQKFNSATGVSDGDLTNSVNMAANGGAATLKDYVAINQSLQMEQQRAVENAAEFQKRAQSEISGRQSSLSSLESMQKQLSLDISKAGTIKPAGPRGNLGNPPIPTPRPEYSPDRNTTGGSVTGPASNTSSLSSPAANYASSLAPAAGAAAGAAGGGGSSTGSGSSSTPYYANEVIGGNDGPSGNTGGASGKNPQGYALAGDGNGGSAGADGNGQAAGNADGQGDPTQMASAGNPSGLYPVSEESISGAASSGASVNSGSYGGGSSASTGFSGSKGAAADSEAAKVKEIAPKAQFSPDLDSGAVNIAGSEVNSALAALEDEFKTEDVKLDLDGLTAGEKKALSPDGALAGGVFSAPSSGGRQLASASQESKAVLDEDSTPLFPRNHGAIERAIKRGDLILGIKKKF